jgi:molybdopterin biosynthesis enzyme
MPDDRLAAAVQRPVSDDVSVIVVTGSTSVGLTDRLRSYVHPVRRPIGR